MAKETSGILKALRAVMEKEGLGAYVIPSEDPHQSEYIAESDKRRAYVTGFTGSRGLAAVSLNNAAMWTDGRYFLSGRRQMDLNWELMKERVEGTPKLSEWLVREVRAGGKVGVDPFLFAGSSYRDLAKSLATSNVTLKPVDRNLVDEVESRWRAAMFGWATVSVSESVSAAAPPVECEGLVRLRGLPQEGDCEGCRERAEKVLRLCGHEWCRECLTRGLVDELEAWVEGEEECGRCPTCRATLSEAEMRSLAEGVEVVTTLASAVSAVSVEVSNPSAVDVVAESEVVSSEEELTRTAAMSTEEVGALLRVASEWLIPGMPELLGVSVLGDLGLPSPVHSFYADPRLELHNSLSPVSALPIHRVMSDYCASDLRVMT